jgi:hypothetical protein
MRKINLLTLVVVEHQLDCDDCIVQPPTLGVHRDVLVHRIHFLLRFSHSRVLQNNYVIYIHASTVFDCSCVTNDATSDARKSHCSFNGAVIRSRVSKSKWDSNVRAHMILQMAVSGFRLRHASLSSQMTTNTISRGKGV